MRRSSPLGQSSGYPRANRQFTILLKLTSLRLAGWLQKNDCPATELGALVTLPKRQQQLEKDGKKLTKGRVDSPTPVPHNTKYLQESLEGLTHLEAGRNY